MFVLLAVSFLTVHSTSLGRERIMLDADWSFFLGDEPQASQPEFDDNDWRSVDLPHDWSIEGTIDKDAPSGRDGGYFPSGVGWYRRTFTPDAAWKDRRVEIEFEGVYQDAEVWINGRELGLHDYGYTPFRYNLTPHLKFGEQNVLAVRVDNSRQPNSRWYSGSGIYRHVWLNVFDAVHFQPLQTLVTTDYLSTEEAILRVTAVVRNDTDMPQDLVVQAKLLDPEGLEIGSKTLDRTLQGQVETAAEFDFVLPRPKLWSPDSPDLYTCVTTLSADGQPRDELSRHFGLRTIHASAEAGLRINGEPTLLYGGCVHHDSGPLGAAAFDRAEARRVEILKAAGFNAIRCAHNPPSAAFLDACDRLGMLVIDEAFDGWAQKKTEHDYSRVFHDEWQADLDAMILRDRQHPSVIMWSIGNEVYERGNEKGLALAKQLSDRVRSWDRSRPVTAGINGLGKPEDWHRLDPFYATLDAAGYNYELHRHAEDHRRVPERVMYASESYQSATFQSWETMVDHVYVIGDFVWSALDYLGEADIGRVFPPDEPARGHWQVDNAYPWHGALCGDIDITGWRKPISHYRQIVWDRGERLYACVLTPSPSGEPWNLFWWSMPPALPSWTWPGHEGKELQVEVYSRWHAVSLYLNDELIGTQPTTRNEEFKTTFRVPYQPGTLRVIGMNNGGGQTESFELVTAEAPAKLQLTPDRARITADGQDLSFVTVEIVDANGRLCPLADNSVKYTVTGPGTIAGIGSGDLSTEQSYQANPRTAYQGHSLVAIRSTQSVGKITLTAIAESLETATAEIEASSGL